MSNLYPNLFSPGKIGNLTLKNRCCEEVHWVVS